MDELLDQVRKLVASGRTIEAVKLLREVTGLSLKEAKEAVDRCAQGGSLDIAEDLAAYRSALHGAAQVDGEIKSLLESGRKIEAIKLMRERSGLDLATAKDIIDSMDGDLKRAGTGRPHPAAVKEGRGGARRWIAVLLIVIAAAVAIYLMRPGA
ncbi:MAG: ribosomal protein L7/L12 [Dongiaceae bacterium]